MAILFCSVTYAVLCLFFVCSAATLTCVGFSLILQIVKEWVKRLTSQKGCSEQMIEKANAVLFTFGSYRLGVTPSFAALDRKSVV